MCTYYQSVLFSPAKISVPGKDIEIVLGFVVWLGVHVLYVLYYGYTCISAYGVVCVCSSVTMQLFIQAVLLLYSCLGPHVGNMCNHALVPSY